MREDERECEVIQWFQKHERREITRLVALIVVPIMMMTANFWKSKNAPNKKPHPNPIAGENFWKRGAYTSTTPGLGLFGSSIHCPKNMRLNG